MTDSGIKVGDVVHDLVKRGKMQVVGKAANSVAEHRKAENFDIAGYKSHPLLGVTDDEAVYTCVYLPDEPTTSFSGTYDFPESRLARIPVEEANEELERIQPDLIRAVLVRLVETADAWDDDDMPDMVVELAKDANLPQDVTERVDEYADAIQRDGGEE